MAGPIDCRVNPTKVNKLANKRDIGWFERTPTASVPINAVTMQQRSVLWHPLGEQGDADAQFHLGVMFESGQGVLRSDAEAIKWYREAAEQDDAVAQFNLGVMYAKGVSPNHAEAALWYRFAADHGLAGAVQPRHDVCRGPGRVPRLCASAHVAGSSSFATSDSGDKSTEHNRRRPRPCRIQNDAAPTRRGAGVGI